VQFDNANAEIPHHLTLTLQNNAKQQNVMFVSLQITRELVLNDRKNCPVGTEEMLTMLILISFLIRLF
jgi:hypothetical protein